MTEKENTEKTAENKSDFFKSKKFFLIFIIVFLAFDLVIFSVLLTVRGAGKLKLNSVGMGESATALVPLDAPAKNNFIKEKQFANYKFTQKQKELFYKVYEEKGSVALTLRINVVPSQNQKDYLTAEDYFRVGFLQTSDFSRNGKVVNQIYGQNKRIVIQGDVVQFLTYYPDGLIDVSFALPKKSEYETESFVKNNVPEGFFVYSTVGCQILDACVTPALLGFDVSDIVPFYGFSYNGGKIDFTNSSFDFSGGSIVFASENSAKKLMPEYKIVFSEDKTLKATSEKASRIEMNFGGEKIYVNNVAVAQEVIVPSAALKNSFSRMDIASRNNGVEAVTLTNSAKPDINKAIKTDPGLILNYPVTKWRNMDYEIFEWDRYPGILFFYTRNYEVQNRLFSRMAFFVEKEGYKGKLLTNVELDGKHGYNAHDYSAASMAEFFNKAAQQNFNLNPEEIALKNILIANGLFDTDGFLVKANEGGLVSISLETKPGTRADLLAHEGWHTIFFRDEEFRNFVSAVYYTMDPDSLAFLMDYFKSQPGLGYDTKDDYLMKNEFMAYIMQQPVSRVGQYFVHHANRGTVIAYTPELAAYVRATKGQGFEDAAIALNDFVFDKYGIVCGNIALVLR